MSLLNALSQLELSNDEGAELSNLLMASVAGVSLETDLDQATARLFCELSDALAQRRPNWSNLGPNGYVWRGRLPEFLPDMLTRLQEDAKVQRFAAIRATKHLLVQDPPFAKVIAECPAFESFVRSLLPNGSHANATASFYHYYETPEDRVEPHVDTDDFGLSCLTVIDHRHEDELSSRFFLSQPGVGPIDLSLSVGESIVFYSGSIVHSRTAPRLGEHVTTASWGFCTSDSGARTQ